MSTRGNPQANWHPDFKIDATLPDTRVIRTSFLSKMFVFTFFLIVALLISQREYQAHLLRKTVGELEVQVQNVHPENLTRLRKSAEFRKLAQSVKELQLFFKAPFLVHKLIVNLASTKPEELSFTRLHLSESVFQVKKGKKTVSQLVFKLHIDGEVQDLPVLTQFKRNLEESTLLNPSNYIVAIEENIQQRDTETEIIPFQLSVVFKPSKDNPTSK